MKKEIKEQTERLKDLSCTWIGWTNTLKMAILPKVIYEFNAIPTKILKQFTEFKKIFLNSIWKQKPRDRETILNNKITAGSISIPNIQLLYKGVIIILKGKSIK